MLAGSIFFYQKHTGIQAPRQAINPSLHEKLFAAEALALE